VPKLARNTRITLHHGSFCSRLTLVGAMTPSSTTTAEASSISRRRAHTLKLSCGWTAASANSKRKSGSTLSRKTRWHLAALRLGRLQRLSWHMPIRLWHTGQTKRPRSSSALTVTSISSRMSCSRLRWFILMLSLVGIR